MADSIISFCTHNVIKSLESISIVNTFIERPVERVSLDILCYDTNDRSKLLCRYTPTWWIIQNLAHDVHFFDDPHFTIYLTTKPDKLIVTAESRNLETYYLEAKCIITFEESQCNCLTQLLMTRGCQCGGS